MLPTLGMDRAKNSGGRTLCVRLEDLRERMIEDGVGALAVTSEGNAEYLFDVGVRGLFLVTQSSVESLVPVSPV